jgi:hypothetical protein
MADAQPPAPENVEMLGKKVFFIHPSALTQNEIISELAQQELEVYVVKDEKKLLPALRRHPQSILFASISEALPPKTWEGLVRGVMTDEATKEVVVGVLAAAENDLEKRFYVNTLKVPAGYVVAKPTVRATKQLLDILKAADAKGRRKYLRADTRDDAGATVNLSYNGKFINGNVRDISVVGFSCVFAEALELEKNSLHTDVQLKLSGSIMKIEAIVFGSRADGDEKAYVFLLTPKISYDTRAKIRAYIQKNLQEKMDAEMK